MVSAPTWNDKFEIPGWSYIVSGIQDCVSNISLKNELLIQ